MGAYESTTHQHADVLTKLDRNLRDRFNAWMERPTIRLSTINGQAFMTSTVGTWSRIDLAASCFRTSSSQGPNWANVIHRRTIDVNDQTTLDDQDIEQIQPDQLHGPLPSPRPRKIVTELTYVKWVPSESRTQA
eukprot:2410473-Amphidinium_carterae.1